jgi:hypothetical protein
MMHAELTEFALENCCLLDENTGRSAVYPMDSFKEFKSETLK